MDLFSCHNLQYKSSSTLCIILEVPSVLHRDLFCGCNLDEGLYDRISTVVEIQHDGIILALWFAVLIFEEIGRPVQSVDDYIRVAGSEHLIVTASLIA